MTYVSRYGSSSFNRFSVLRSVVLTRSSSLLPLWDPWHRSPYRDVTSVVDFKLRTTFLCQTWYSLYLSVSPFSLSNSFLRLPCTETVSRSVTARLPLGVNPLPFPDLSRYPRLYERFVQCVTSQTWLGRRGTRLTVLGDWVWHMFTLLTYPNISKEVGRLTLSIDEKADTYLLVF